MDLQKLRAGKATMATKIVGAETVLVPLKENVAELSEMFTLNEVGSFIWEQLDKVGSNNEIVSAVVAEFDIDTKTAQTDVSDFLTTLEEFILRD